LLNYVMFFDSLNNALVASTIFVLRRRRVASTEGGYHVPLYPVVPAFFVLFLLSITVNVVLSQPGSILIGISILLAGFPIFLLMRRVSKAVNASGEKAGEISS